MRQPLLHVPEVPKDLSVPSAGSGILPRVLQLFAFELFIQDSWCPATRTIIKLSIILQPLQYWFWLLRWLMTPMKNLVQSVLPHSRKMHKYPAVWMYVSCFTDLPKSTCEVYLSPCVISPPPWNPPGFLPSDHPQLLPPALLFHVVLEGVFSFCSCMPGLPE